MLLKDLIRTRRFKIVALITISGLLVLLLSDVLSLSNKWHWIMQGVGLLLCLPVFRYLLPNTLNRGRRRTM